MAQSCPELQQLKDIYNSNESFDGDKLTEQAKQKITSLDYSNFTYNDLLEVKKLDKLPLNLVNSIFKGFMRRQDELLVNLGGNFIYSQTIEKSTLSHYFDMLGCPNLEYENELVITDILHRIAAGGVTQTNSNVQLKTLVDAKNFDKGIIRFDQSKFIAKNNEHGVQCLFDFDPSTYYQNITVQEPYFIIGFPPFMKVRLISYKLYGPPQIPGRRAQGGPKNWQIWASNNWNDINNSDKSAKIHSVVNDSNLIGGGKSAEYKINLEKDQYYRYFKFVAIGEQHQGDNFIYLSGIDFSGNIEICDE